MHHERNLSNTRPGLLPLAAIALSVFGVLPAAGQPVTEDLKLLPFDGTAGAEFGNSIAIADGIVAVGAYHDDEHGVRSGAAYLFDASTGAFLLKLVPDDAGPEAWFGQSIAIADGLVAVGALATNDNGTFSGSAYLFDAVTGAQLFKLLPNDGAANDTFGGSIAIADGLVAVGSMRGKVNGVASGSAYVFDAATGQQTVKLVPADGMADDFFGISIAFNNGVVAVGAALTETFDPFTTQSGSAYLFDATTGTQLAKLLPIGLNSFDKFGQCIAIADGLVAVGSPGDGDNGSFSGSAYLFDASTGAQITKLLPTDGADGDQFGTSIAMANGVVAVGAYFGGDGASAPGFAYLFDASTGVQTAKLLASDGVLLDQFGVSIDIDGGVVAVGANLDDDNDTDSGSAYVFFAEPDTDTDGDGLLDDWEDNGIPYTGVDGTSRRYLLFGADKMHKTLYVEIDTMPENPFSAVASDLVTEAFANAPVDNPDGTTGIEIFISTDVDSIPTQAVSETINNEFPPTAALDKADFFGSPLEREDPDRVPMLQAKAKAFRYALGYRKASTNLGGLGELGGNDFVIFSEGYSDIDEAAVFMHELGHNLNLEHGGRDETNRKPNYPSIMNYALSYREAWNARFWRLDYSREELAPLDEASLDETVSVGFGGSGFYRNWRTPWFGTPPVDSGCSSNPGDPNIFYAKLSITGGNDFNLDCDKLDVAVAADLNFDARDPGADPSPNENMLGNDDWSYMTLPISDNGGPFGGRPPTGEVTDDDRAFIDANFPVPPDTCGGDWNDDGYVNTLDVLAFLNDWAASEYWADLNLDGLVNTQDVLAFLNAWVAGC